MRPTGLTTPPAVKRYQQTTSAPRPSTSTCTVWSVVALVVSVPDATIEPAPNAGSSATSQSTAMPAPAAAGSMRVHSTTPSPLGSPDATPDGYRSTGT